MEKYNDQVQEKRHAIVLLQWMALPKMVIYQFLNPEIKREKRIKLPRVGEWYEKQDIY